MVKKQCTEPEINQEVASVSGKSHNGKGRNKASKNAENFQNVPKPRGKERRGEGSSELGAHSNKDRLQKALKVEPSVKEEGEMSDNEEVYEQFKEVKWMEWCSEVMMTEERTLRRLHKLQSVSDELPKEKVLSKIWSYLQLLGRRIDEIVIEHAHGAHKSERMMMRLWKYVSTHSNLSGERLYQIYSKLKQEQEEELGISALPWKDLDAPQLELPIHQRGDAVSSLMYEATARMRDPVYRCVGAISYL